MIMKIYAMSCVELDSTEDICNELRLTRLNPATVDGGGGGGARNAIRLQDLGGYQRKTYYKRIKNCHLRNEFK